MKQFNNISKEKAGFKMNGSPVAILPGTSVSGEVAAQSCFFTWVKRKLIGIGNKLRLVEIPVFFFEKTEMTVEGSCNRRVYYNFFPPSSRFFQRKRPGSKLRAGFTLIEVLVALIIIAIACFAVLHVVSSTINMNRRLEQHMVGTWVSENVLADLRANALTIPTDTRSLDGKTNMLYHAYPWHATLLEQNGFIGHYDQAVGISVKSTGNKKVIIWRLHGFIPLQDGVNGR